MDVKDAAIDPKWDQERLGYLAQPLEDYGDRISKDVIREIAPQLADCQCVRTLLPNLYRKRVINDVDFQKLQQPAVTGMDLFSALKTASGENLGRGKHLIRNLYLSLLDLFAQKCNEWCHYIALHVLRKTAISHLSSHVDLPPDPKIDKQSVLASVPDVTLQSPAAAQLRRHLHIPTNGTEVTSLRLILKTYMATAPDDPKPEKWLAPLVKAMMLTQGVGRYVSKLVPFYKSYPVEVLLFLENNQQHWETFALYLGFTAEEVADIQSISEAHEDIKYFQRVWRMPDLKKKQNEEILHLTLQQARGPATSSPQSCNPRRVPSWKIESPLVSSQSVATERRHAYRGQKSDSSGYHSIENQSVPYGSRQVSMYDDDDTSMISQPQMRENRIIPKENDSAQHPFSPSEMSYAPSPFQFPTRAFPSRCQSSPDPPSSNDDCSSLEPDRGSQRPRSLRLSAKVSRSQSATPGTSCFPFQFPTRAVPPHCQSSPHPPSSNDDCSSLEPNRGSQRPISLRLSGTVSHSLSPIPGTSRFPMPFLFQPNDEVMDTSEALGAGVYGKVLVVTHRGRQYAAKRYRNDFITPDTLEMRFTQKILSLRLNHRNIVSVLGVCRLKDTREKVVVMERFHQSLESIASGEKKELVQLKLETKISIISQIANGLVYLHRHGIIHCGIIPANIMLTVPECVAKISDYGNSLVKSISEVSEDFHMDQSKRCDYLPPEAFAGQISDKVDVFSFGHLLLFIILQQEPHPLKNHIKNVGGIRVGRTELERREDFVRGCSLSEKLLRWTKSCLADEADERPHISKFHDYI